MNPALPKIVEVKCIMENRIDLTKMNIKVGIEKKGRAG